MELSPIALKALISFSFGLSANTVQCSVLADTIKNKKPVTTINAKKEKPVKAQTAKTQGLNQQTTPDNKPLNSCGKCEKG